MYSTVSVSNGHPSFVSTPPPPTHTPVRAFPAASSVARLVALVQHNTIPSTPLLPFAVLPKPVPSQTRPRPSQHKLVECHTATHRLVSPLEASSACPPPITGTDTHQLLCCADQAGPRAEIV
jgi:hypothetical protein